MIYIPNIITVIRILLVVPISWLLLEGRHVDALFLMVIAGLSDAFDGFLARRFNWLTQLGATLDPLADKLLVAAVFLVFTWQGHIPLWIAIIVLVRDFVIVAGAGVYKVVDEEVEISPTFLSKANTAMQLVVLIFLLVGLLPLGVMSDLAVAMVNPYSFYILAVLGVSSGLDYVFTWGSKAYREDKKRKLYKHGPGRMRKPS
jgi:cardiolipin synthase